MDAAQEMLTNLTREIAEDAEQTRREMDGVRARHLGHQAERQHLGDAWRNHNLRVAPLKMAREHIIKQIASIEAMKPPGPIFIPKP